MNGNLRLISIVIFLLLSRGVVAQTGEGYATGNIYNDLLNLNTVGSALYIAAHPDDENTRLITYLSKGRHISTAYLSLTRGDGGQNLIGTEKGPKLGVIRTYELLAARSLDGGKQFFTRANDFGYSKTAEETFNIWDRDKVLADVVWAIRRTKPDVIITRFPPEKYHYPTHGHHQASAILAEEAFELAADPDAFPEQLKYVDVWQTKRLYWNTSTWFYRRTNQPFDSTGKILMDCGAYNAFLGKSCGEIAGESRSQHKSQGFGASRQLGEVDEYFEFVKGTEANKDLFEDIDLTWRRFENGDEIERILHKAYAAFNPKEPESIIPLLLQARELMMPLIRDIRVAEKYFELNQLILHLTGVYFEATTGDHSIVAGDSVDVKVSIINRSDYPVKLQSIYFYPTSMTLEMDSLLPPNRLIQFEQKGILSSDYEIKTPYWLKEKQESIGMYNVNDQRITGMPVRKSNLQASVFLKINGNDFEFKTPLQFKWVDRVKGEQFRDVVVAPPATVNILENVRIFNTDNSQDVALKIKAWENDITGSFEVQLPEGWTSNGSDHSFHFDNKGDEQIFHISVTPPGHESGGELQIILNIDGKKYNYSLTDMHYDHLPYITYFESARSKLVHFKMKKCEGIIGYIMGAGDNVPENLERIGFKVEMIDRHSIESVDLSDYQAILIGIRAYNTQEWLPGKKQILMDYVKNGGNLIVQYQTTWGILTQDFSPYPMTVGSERVTEEDAKMNFTNNRERILNYPNKITEADFENWVQERGLYFAKEWDGHFRPVFKSHDTGEKDSEGSLIVADYGKGTFMYTGISFFRELPAGVSGAFRLLANIICYKK
jgi:LmbE family N-acetylglucosaminyl deacetylase